MASLRGTKQSQDNDGTSALLTPFDGPRMTTLPVSVLFTSGFFCFVPVAEAVCNFIFAHFGIDNQ